MANKRINFLFLLFIGSFSFLFAADDNINDDESHIDALREWIATKRQVTVKETGGSLSLSGEVHVGFLSANEQKNGYKNIGANSLHPDIAADQFNVEFDLLFDYRADYTWASIKMKFENDMGLIGGTFDNISMDRAFLGFRILDGEKFTIDFELGRRKLSYTFDSRLEFKSYFDGLMIKFSRSSDIKGDFYINFGPFVVNETRDQFAYVAELGLLNIYNTGVYFKYSIIDWNTKHYSDPAIAKRFQFITSQFLLGYKFVSPVIGKVATLYGAYLINTAAKRNAILNYHRDNMAGYLGFYIGEIRKRGDWSFDTNFQYVLPQAIAEFDFSGIGNGNHDNAGLYTINTNGSGGATTRSNAAGKENYWGWQFEFLYLISQNLTVSQSFKLSRPLDCLPTKYKYKQYRLEFIYTW